MTAPTPAYSAEALQLKGVIEELIASDRLAEAIDLAEQGLARGLVHARFHGLVAFRLEEQGRNEEATEELGNGLALEPANIELITSLGYCFLNLERIEESVFVFRRALAVNPDWEPAQFGLGSALRIDGDLVGAATMFGQVLAKNPTHMLALTALAGLAEMRGARDDARHFADRALALDPENPAALLVCARLELAAKDLAVAEATSRRLIEKAALEPEARGDARHTLGDILDAQGRVHEAFEAYVIANAEIAEALTKRAAPRQESAREAAERTVAAFLRTPPERWAIQPSAGPTGPTAQHVFLIGFPRSGTTLIENVLAGHPDIVTLEERPTMLDSEAAFMTQPDGLDRLSLLEGSDLERFRQAYWDRVQDMGIEADGRIFIDKHPLAALLAPVIAKLFPNAKILFALRDPRDVVLSCFRRNFKMNPAMQEFTGLERTVRFYDIVMRARVAYFAKLALPIHEIRHERLVADFDSEVGAVCDFLGITLTDSMRDFSQTARSRVVRSRSSNQVTEGLNTKGLGQWRRYDWALEPVMPILEPWVRHFGYEA